MNIWFPGRYKGCSDISDYLYSICMIAGGVSGGGFYGSSVFDPAENLPKPVATIFTSFKRIPRDLHHHQSIILYVNSITTNWT